MKSAQQAGFSLIELLVSVVIMAEILVGVAILFDSSNRLARSQTHVAELQQSLRVGQSEVVRFARMAGIGGLPITRLDLPAEPTTANTDYDLLGAFPREGYAVSVLNGAADGTLFNSSTGDSVELLEGSDVLILRGVFTTPMYYFDPPVNLVNLIGAGPLAMPIAIDDATVTISNRVRTAGQYWEDYPQDVGALGSRLWDALNSSADVLHQQTALILRDTLNPNHYIVAELDGDTVSAALKPAACGDATSFPDETCLRSITFDLHLNTTAGKPGEAYAELTAGTTLTQGGINLPLPAVPTLQLPQTVGSIGLLEEYRFFVRVEHEVPGDTSTRLTPVLCRARFLPGTDEMIERIDVADNIIDLQIAVGVDANTKGHVGYGVVFDDDSEKDEILFNHAKDTSGVKYLPPMDETADSDAAVTWYDTWEGDGVEFHFLRINTLVQSRAFDSKIQAPALEEIEDFNRGTTETINTTLLGSVTYNDETQYHRRWLQTVVELRNLL